MKAITAGSSRVLIECSTAAGHRHPVMRLEHGRGIGQHHRDGIAIADAPRGQRRGKPPRARIELGIARAALAMDDGGVIGECRRRALEEDERRQRLIIGLGLAEVDVVRACHWPRVFGAFPCRTLAKLQAPRSIHSFVQGALAPRIIGERRREDRRRGQDQDQKEISPVLMAFMPPFHRSARSSWAWAGAL